MIDAAANGSEIVVCTCSTIGGIAERTPTEHRFKAMRIDRAMADRAVQRGVKILVVAALESTLQPTTDLIRESANALGRSVIIQHLLVEEAWAHFKRGDQQVYIRAVVTKLQSHPIEADVVVLAQASMAPAAEELQNLGIEVLSSPALGVEDLLHRLGF